MYRVITGETVPLDALIEMAGEGDAFSIRRLSENGYGDFSPKDAGEGRWGTRRDTETSIFDPWELSEDHLTAEVF